MQKVHLFGYKNSPEFGLCQPHYKFKRRIKFDHSEFYLTHLSYGWTTLS